MIRMWLLAAVLLSVIAAPSPSAATAKASETPVPAAEAASETETDTDALLQLSIEGWIAQLAAEPGFEAWERSSWETYPLGPGTHGWVVLIKDEQQQEAGYLVVGAAAEGGYRLVEYGTGDMPLFSETTLRSSLQRGSPEGVQFTARAQIDRLYLDAMRAFWKVTENGVTRYADAKSGVWLPETFTARTAGGDSGGDFEGTANSLERSGAPLHKLTAAADPYATLDWLDAPEQAVGGWDDFAALWENRAGALVFRAELDGSVMIPYGVAGYHWWSPAPTDIRFAADRERRDAAPSLQGFVALEDYGTRYVPLDVLRSSGSFH